MGWLNMMPLSEWFQVNRAACTIGFSQIIYPHILENVSLHHRNMFQAFLAEVVGFEPT